MATVNGLTKSWDVGCAAVAVSRIAQIDFGGSQMPSKWTGRKPMSVLVKPGLQRRLKVCAAKLGISRSELIEQLCVEGIREKEFDWGALQEIRKTSP